MNGWVRDLTVYNGKLFAGGYFNAAGEEPAAYIASWSPSTVIKGDLNHDCVIDFYDVCLFAQQWLNGDCEYTGFCGEADLNYSREVDFADYAAFARHWLEGI